MSKCHRAERATTPLLRRIRRKLVGEPVTLLQVLNGFRARAITFEMMLPWATPVEARLRALPPGMDTR